MSPLAVEAYLLARIEPGPGGCWLWRLKTDRGGYGLAWINGRGYRAARLAYETWIGEIPPGHDIHHLCQHRHCVNPAHLEAKPRGEHIRFHCQSGSRAGEKNSQAKLRAIDVQFIRLAQPFLSASTLAQECGIGERNVYHIQSGEGWRHLEWPTIPEQINHQEVGRHGLNTLQRLKQQRRKRGEPQPPFIEESIILARVCAGAWE